MDHEWLPTKTGIISFGAIEVGVCVGGGRGVGDFPSALQEGFLGSVCVSEGMRSGIQNGEDEKKGIGFGFGYLLS